MNIRQHLNTLRTRVGRIFGSRQEPTTEKPKRKWLGGTPMRVEGAPWWREYQKVNRARKLVWLRSMAVKRRLNQRDAEASNLRRGLYASHAVTAASTSVRGQV